MRKSKKNDQNIPVKVYSNGKKAAAIIIQSIFMIVLVLCIYVIKFCFDRSMLSKDVMNNVEYTQTEYFEDEVKDQIFELLKYLQYKRDFESEGIYDVTKIVDIYDYIDNNVITGKETKSIGYHLNDLLEWGREGINYKTYYVVYKSEKKKPEVLTSEQYENLDNTEELDFMEMELIDERYLPVDGLNLLEFYDANYFKNVDSLKEMSDYIVRTIKALPLDINYYKEKTTQYKEENSNILYYIQNNADDEYYTNMSDTSNLMGTIKNLGKYIYVDAASLNYEGNLGSIESKLYTHLDEAEFLAGYDYTVYIGVDTSLQKDDVLYKAKLQYQSLMPWFMVCLCAGAISFIMVLISFGYLCAIAGYCDSQKKVVLAGFDKIKTEIAAGILIGAAGVVLYVDYLSIVSIYRTEATTTMFLLGTSVFVLDGLFLTGILSLIRRLRAKSIWSNSIVYTLVKLGRKIASSLEVSIRSMALYTAFIIANILLLLETVYNDDYVAAGILIIMYFTVGYGVLKESLQKKLIIEGVEKIRNGELEYKIDTESLGTYNTELAQEINKVGEGLYSAVEASIKNERLKTDLITNVSHDIKTPLTSIINYVDLIKREHIDNEKIKNYVEVLDSKSQRLKHLTEDLVEASKISSGNIVINMDKLNFMEFVNQTAGEFSEKFEAVGLVLVLNIPSDPVVIMADGMRLWRVIENLYNNIAKYAMPNTRVYADLSIVYDEAVFSIKNISKNQLNINADELTERFIRGDVSRGTEGSGLGLSIAKNLTELQKGKFDVYLDGDLFKVTLKFKLADKVDEEELSL